MNKILIKASGGGYDLLISNDPDPNGVIEFVLNQDSPSAPVELLAQCMQKGSGEVISNAEYIFQGSEVVNAEWMQVIFGSSDAVFLGDASVFTVGTIGASVLDELAIAGAELASALI